MKRKIKIPKIIQIGLVARRFLDFLDREKIQSLDDLEARIGRDVQIPGGNDFIKIVKRPSNQNTVAIVADYIISGEMGVPLSVIMNSVLLYSQLILKSKIYVSGFQPFPAPLDREDIYGNKYQFQTVKGTNVGNIRLALQGLAKKSGEYAFKSN